MRHPIHIDLPEDAKVANYLFIDMTVDELNQDLATVCLSNGYCIEVGWFPENDPAGFFVIQVFSSDRLEEVRQLKTTDAYDAAQLVEQLAQAFDRLVISVSRTSNISSDEVSV